MVGFLHFTFLIFLFTGPPLRRYQNYNTPVHQLQVDCYKFSFSVPRTTPQMVYVILASRRRSTHMIRRSCVHTWLGCQQQGIGVRISMFGSCLSQSRLVLTIWSAQVASLRKWLWTTWQEIKVEEMWRPRKNKRIYYTAMSKNLCVCTQVCPEVNAFMTEQFWKTI